MRIVLMFNTCSRFLYVLTNMTNGFHLYMSKVVFIHLPTNMNLYYFPNKEKAKRNKNKTRIEKHTELTTCTIEIRICIQNIYICY